MPGSHTEWAFQIPVSRLPKAAQKGQWKVYLSARVETRSGAPTAEPAGAGFHTGVWDTKSAAQRAFAAVPVSDGSAKYKSYLLGTVELHRDQYIWVSPTANPIVDSVWVDRVYLVPETVPGTEKGR
jgi:hypothetical protein